MSGPFDEKVPSELLERTMELLDRYRKAHMELKTLLDKTIAALDKEREECIQHMKDKAELTQRLIDEIETHKGDIKELLRQRNLLIEHFVGDSDEGFEEVDELLELNRDKYDLH